VTDEENLRDVVEELADGLAEELMVDYNSAIKEVQDVVNRVYDGTADETERLEYRTAVGDTFQNWTNLVVSLFAKHQEHPMSPTAIEFYSLTDATRALLGLDPIADEIIQNLRENGHIGNLDPNKMRLNKDDDD
jgi:hypothetical protein